MLWLYGPATGVPLLFELSVSRVGLKPCGRVREN